MTKVQKHEESEIKLADLSDLDRNRALSYVNYLCKSVELLTFFKN